MKLPSPFHFYDRLQKLSEVQQEKLKAQAELEAERKGKEEVTAAAEGVS